MGNIRLHIDGKEIEIEKGKSLLEAALYGGIYIPHLCHHPDLKPVGNCGLCVVDVEGVDEPVTSCTTQAVEGMEVKTKTDLIDRLRHQAMEILLANHPQECLECSQYLNCELQSVKQYLGITEKSEEKRQLRPIPIDTRNPLFVHDFIRCIKCERCVRACSELSGAGILQSIKKLDESLIAVMDNLSLAEAGCRFCGACVEVCPTGAMRDREELLEGKKRREALIPCANTCPAGIDVPRYIRLVREKKYSEATAVIREKVPFPGVLGFVCDHPCETVCRRGQVNESISIRDLKRVATERDSGRLWEQKVRRDPPRDTRVAVVGAGPAGLTSAYYLALLGHGVTVFDALPLAGGMMRYGIPAYRLPRDLLDSEIGEIEKIGVELRTSTRIESLDGLIFDEGYDAVLVAVGAHDGKRLPVPGADLDSVFIGLRLLRDVNLGKNIEVGKNVLVIGGGNVAFDCARVARRLGAEDIHIACLESREKMPASWEEIVQGEEEGIFVHCSKMATRILSEKGEVVGVEFRDVESFEFDEDGNPHADALDGSEQIFEAETVIFAIGQSPEVPDEFELDTDDLGHIEVDPYTYDTSQEGVFAAGDAVTGTSSVIEAIASGRKAAAALDRFLGGEGNIDQALAPPEEVVTWKEAGKNFPFLKRVEGSCVAAGERIRGFCGIAHSLDETSATEEAKRCLQCDLRLRISPVRFWGDY